MAGTSSQKPPDGTGLIWTHKAREMALLMVGYLIGKFGAERNGPDGQFSASCPPGSLDVHEIMAARS